MESTNRTEKESAAEILTRVKDIKRDYYPLSPIQMGVYLSCVNSPDSTMYNIPTRFEVSKDSNIDLPRFLEAVKETLQNHNAANFVITETEGIPMLKEKQFEVEIPVEKIPEDSLKEALNDFYGPLDLYKGPLYSCKLFETESKYVLAINYHHIAFDGTSVTVLNEEIRRRYLNEKLEPEEYSVFDIALFEEQVKDSKEYEKSYELYKKNFEGKELNTRLPFDYPEGASNLVHPNVILNRFVPKTLNDKEIETFLKEKGLTENTLFLGALFYTTAKYLGQEEPILFTVNHGRSDKRMRNTLAMMVKPLPISVEIDENESIDSFLHRVQENQHTTQKNSLYPLSKMVQEFGFDMDIQFVFQKQIAPDLVLGDDVVHYFHIPPKDAMAPFSLSVYKKDKGYDLEYEYGSDLYDEETIDNFDKFYRHIISEMLHRQTLKDIVLADEEETQKVINISRAEETPVDLNYLFLDRFDKTLKEYPNKTALVYNGKNYSYQEVDEMSSLLADNLIAKGVKPGDIVGILIDRSEFMVILPIAVLKAGAAYLPLDLKSPQERLEYMLEDSAVSIVLAQENLINRIPGFKGEIITTEQIPDLNPVTVNRPEINPQDLFIVIYTSGSTGTPKGVKISHKNISNLINWSSQIDQLNPESRYALHSNFSFDPHLMGTYPVLSTGGEVHVIPEDKRLDLVWFNDYCIKNNITNTDLTTQFARTYMNVIDDIAPIRITTGGEKLPAIKPREGVTFLNQYGPTELTVVTTNYPVEEYSESIPIGKPVGNAHLYIIDKERRLLPQGAFGELAVAGPLVAQGYLNLPEKTAEVFLPNPFENNENYETLYKTGDIVRFNNEGNLEIFGRQDEMVKIRGYRIELSEVNSAVASYEPVTDSFVTSFIKEGGGEALAAYFVSDEEIDISKLRDYIAGIKPEYMIPEVFIQLEAIPLTPNGKVNKKLLPQPRTDEKELPAVQNETEFKVYNNLETRILNILEKIIETKDVPLKADLKFYGLNSISAITLAVELKKELGINIDIKSLLNNPTVLSIENQIIEKLFENREGDIKEQSVILSQPLSSSQFGVYAESMKNPGDTSYNIPFYFLLPETVDLEKLKQAVKDIVNTHSSLKINLKLEDDGVIQYLVDKEPDIPVKKMTEEELVQYKKDFNRPFHLLDTPLYRIEIIETPEHKYLLLNFHHIIFDGFSSDLFTRDLARAYNGETLKTENRSYFDYSAEETSDKEKYDNSKEFYLEMLKNSEGSSILPTNKKESGESALLSIPFDLEKIEEFCKQRGITPAQLFLASTLYTVARYTNSEGAYINTISNGRTNLDYQDTYGMFVKTLPIGLELPKETVEDFINISSKLLSDVVLNDSYPYYEIAKDFNYSPSILYAYQLGIGAPTTIEGEELQRQQLGEREAKFDTGVYIEKVDGQNSISVLYDSGRYDTDYMENFINSIKTVTESFITNPEKRLREISTLDKNGLAQIEEFSVTGTENLEAFALHELLEKQAQENPLKIALIASDGEFNYQKLNENANRIANELIQLGVKKGDRIALLLNRDSSFLSSLYGVLKAGAAFIPITKQYPKERIEQILNDSSARYIITTEDECEKFNNSLNITELEQGTNTKNPEVEVLPEDLAYLIYTSGSTGKPKGVMLKHEGIVNYVTKNQASPHVQAIIDEGNVYGSITSVSFDMSLKETVMSLSNGLTLVLADEEQINNPAALADFFIKNKVDVFNATPSRIEILMEEPRFFEFLNQCKVIIAGAEKYPEQLLEKLQKTGAQLFNTYGPTEITVSANAKELTKANRVSVGKPLLNVKEYIVDSDLNPVPVGVTGELLIGGKGVALGYNNLEEETKKAFIEFGGERFYRTGDLAKWNSDGEVEILGRNDSQVKIRGLRVELGEIEKAIEKTGLVSSAHVLVKDFNGNDVLCLYYTGEKEIESDTFKNSLKQTLPDYMIPEFFIKLEQIPVTINGKIDLKNLPEPTEAKHSIKEEEKAATFVEQEIIDIFRNVLGIDTISRKDNFFEYGGSSLLVTRVVIEAGKRHLNIAYGDLFDHPTPELLAQHLSGTNIMDSNLDDFRDYDYTRINEILSKNTLDNFITGKRQELGDVILTGATGFLGIHILNELLNTTDSHVTIFQRGKKGLSPLDRIDGLYYYYFDQSLLDNFKDRITVIEGDITNKESFENLKQVNADTFINCAANVKHYAEGSEIESVDYYGVVNIVDYCKESDTNLIQVSTMSIGGIFLDQPGNVQELHEDQLFYGQFQNSKYTSSKFLAERMILEEVANGLNAKIMRVGNLSPRESDGEFQINFTTNTFMGRLRAISKLGYYPFEFSDNKFELSPIDYVAKAILQLAQTPKENVVLHPFNNHILLMHDLYNQLETIGTPVKGVEYDEFNEVVGQAQDNPEMAQLLSSFIAYENSAHGRKIYSVNKSNEMTMQILHRLGFNWPVTSLEYMKKFLLILSDELFFD